RKIRNLMKTFPCIRIGMDAQGGGRGVEEALHNPKNLEPNSNEQLIWPIIIEDEPQITDNMPGLHILELIEFANYEWTSGANNGLRKDLEDKSIRVPRYDGISLGMAYELNQRELDVNEQEIKIKKEI